METNVHDLHVAVAENAGASWKKYKEDMAQALEDPNKRTKWRLNKDTIKKTKGMTMMEYVAAIRRGVKKYEKEYANNAAAIERSVAERVVAGLSESERFWVNSQVHPEERLDVRKIMRSMVHYEERKEDQGRDKEKAVTFAGETIAALTKQEEDRVKQAEMGIEELKVQIQQLQQKVAPQEQRTPERSQSYNGRRSNYRERDRPTPYNRHRSWSRDDNRRRTDNLFRYGGRTDSRSSGGYGTGYGSRSPYSRTPEWRNLNDMLNQYYSENRDQLNEGLEEIRNRRETGNGRPTSKRS